MTESVNDKPKSIRDIPGFDEALAEMLAEEEKPVTRARNKALLASGLLSLSLIATFAWVCRKPIAEVFSNNNNERAIDVVAPSDVDDIPKASDVSEPLTSDQIDDMLKPITVERSMHP